MATFVENVNELSLCIGERYWFKIVKYNIIYKIKYNDFENLINVYLFENYF